LVSPPSEAPPAVAHSSHFRRIARSFGYAVEGLTTVVRTQPNFWIHVAAGAAALALGVALKLSPVELAVIVITIALVLAVECVNTTLETLCDLISPAFHPLVKRAKDVSAAAVLICAIASVTVALLLFGPRLMAFLGV
jgi:diacylglycerol kinase